MSEITIIKPEQVAAAFNSVEIKAKAAQIAQQCNEVVIVDDSSMAIAQAIFTDANKTITKIEKVRKTLKQPYIDMGNRIQQVAKELSEEIEKAVKSGKEKILAWNQEVEKKKLADQARIDEQARENERKANEEKARIEKITDWIKDFEESTTTEINGAGDKPKLAEIFATRIKTFPPDAFFAEFLEDGKAALERVKNAGKSRRIHLDKLAETTDAAAAAELKRKEEKRQTIVSRNMAENAESLEEKKEEALDVVQTDQELKVADLTGQSIAVQNEKVSGITKRWTFEITDMNLVPRKYFIVDEQAIRKWMNDNKEILVDGEVLDGIKFYKKEGVRL